MRDLNGVLTEHSDSDPGKAIRAHYPKELGSHESSEDAVQSPVRTSCVATARAERGSETRRTQVVLVVVLGTPIYVR